MAEEHSVLWIATVYVEGRCGAWAEGCGGLDTRHSPFPLLVADGLQRKGGKGRAYRTGGLSKSPVLGYPQADSSGLNCRGGNLSPCIDEAFESRPRPRSRMWQETW